MLIMIDILLYNCAIIFFILSFFIGYILSFGLVRLRTIQLSARAGVHTRGGYNNHRCHNIKTPDGKSDWGVDDVMPGSDGLGILVIFEKAVSWDSKLGEASWDLSLGEAVEIWYWMKRVEIRTWSSPVGSTGRAARLLGQMELST